MNWLRWCSEIAKTFQTWHFTFEAGLGETPTFCRSPPLAAPRKIKLNSIWQVPRHVGLSKWSVTFSGCFMLQVSLITEYRSNNGNSERVHEKTSQYNSLINQELQDGIHPQSSSKKWKRDGRFLINPSLDRSCSGLGEIRVEAAGWLATLKPNWWKYALDNASTKAWQESCRGS